MVKQMSDEELVYSLALFNQGCASLRCEIDGHSHRRGLLEVATIEEARPSVEELKKAIDGVFFIHDAMSPEQIIEQAGERKRLYHSMLRTYEADPSYLDGLMITVIRKRVLGWGREKEYFNQRDVRACPRN